MIEVWRQIEDFIGYEVSNHGRVRSWWKTSRDKRVWRHTPVYLTPSKTGKNPGYYRFTISINGDKFTRRIHNAVLNAFVGPAPDGMWGLHGDGDETNNRLDNLRWGTPKENADDRSKHGRTIYGSKNHKAKLTKDKIMSIRYVYLFGIITQTELAVFYEVQQTTISSVLLHKNWKRL